MGSDMSSVECDEQDTFNISEAEVPLWLYLPLDSTIITIVIPIIWCFGVFTNFTFLFVLFRVPKIRTDTSVYLGHLTIADLLYLNLQSIYYVWSYVASPLAFDDPFQNSAGCISLFTVISGGYFVAIGLVTMVSFERYRALCHPIKHLQVCSRQRTYKIVTICWLVGFAVSGATVIRSGFLKVYCLHWPDGDAYQQFPATFARCKALPPWVQTYIIPLVNFPWLIAMVSNVYMYIRIIHALSKRRQQNRGAEGNKAALQVRNQVAKALVVNGVVFFLCQAPYRIITFSFWICAFLQIPEPISTALGDGAMWAALIPQFVNSSVNPLIYGTMNAQYRAALIQAFQCKRQPVQAGSHNPPPAISAEVQKGKGNTGNSTSNDTSDTRL